MGRLIFLEVSTPTNDYGPDFILTEVDEGFLEKVERWAHAVEQFGLGVSISGFHYPEWYRGTIDCFVREEHIDPQTGELDLDAAMEECSFEEARAEVSQLVVTATEFYWTAESFGGDLYTSNRMNISELRKLLGVSEEPKRPMFTVVCLYPDYATGDYGEDVYINSAEAEDGHEAAVLVQHMAAEANNDIPPEDFRVIAVMAGDVPVVLDATSFEPDPKAYA